MSHPFFEESIDWMDKSKLAYVAHAPWEAMVMIEEHDGAWRLAIEFCNENIHAGLAPVDILGKEGFTSRGEARMFAERAVREWTVPVKETA